MVKSKEQQELKEEKIEKVKTKKETNETKETKEKVNLKTLKIGVLKVEIIGTSPYMPEPMDLEMLERYDKKSSKQTYEKDTQSAEEKAKKKFYYTDDGEYGIPARQFYNAMIRGSSYLYDRNSGGMRIFREGINIIGNILPLKYKKLTQAQMWGRSSGMSKAPMKIVRNQFHDWRCILEIQYNQNQLSAEEIINVLQHAGFYVGVGAFRKEKTGNYGAFMVKL